MFFFEIIHQSLLFDHQSLTTSCQRITPTESFLRYLALPDDESEFVELQHAAVVLISHLDRLSAPYTPPLSNQNLLVSHLTMDTM